MEPVNYQYNDQYWDETGSDSVNLIPSAEKNRVHFGFVANEVKNVLPNVVDEHPNKDFYSLYRGEILPVAVSGIQEQQKQIEHLKNQIQNLQSQINCLKQQIDGCGDGDNTN